MVGIEFKRAAQSMRVTTHEVLLPFSTWQCPGDTHVIFIRPTKRNLKHRLQAVCRSALATSVPKFNLTNFGKTTGSWLSTCFTCRRMCAFGTMQCAAFEIRDVTLTPCVQNRSYSAAGQRVAAAVPVGHRGQ